MYINGMRKLSFFGQNVTLIFEALFSIFVLSTWQKKVVYFLITQIKVMNPELLAIRASFHVSDEL